MESKPDLLSHQTHFMPRCRDGKQTERPNDDHELLGEFVAIPGEFRQITLYFKVQHGLATLASTQAWRKPGSQNLLRRQFACRRRNVGMSSKSSLGRGGASRSLVSTRVDAGVSALGAREGSAVGASGCRVSDAPAAAGRFIGCRWDGRLLRLLRPARSGHSVDQTGKSGTDGRRTPPVRHRRRGERLGLFRARRRGVGASIALGGMNVPADEEVSSCCSVLGAPAATALPASEGDSF